MAALKEWKKNFCNVLADFGPFGHFLITQKNLTKCEQNVNVHIKYAKTNVFK